MERELIEKYKKQREFLVLKRNEMIAKNERLELLRQNPIVKEYLELEKECENRELIDGDIRIFDLIKDDIDFRIYYSICENITDTNNIYVSFGKGYSGYYDNGKLILCCPIPKEIRVSCAFYKNLENCYDGYIIRDEECEEFEKNHIVIHDIFHYISASSMKEYEMLSRNFVFDILNYGNEEAVKRVLSKYNQNL